MPISQGLASYYGSDFIFVLICTGHVMAYYVQLRKINLNWQIVMVFSTLVIDSPRLSYHCLRASIALLEL